MAHIFWEDTLQKTMQMYGVKLHGQLLPCNACMRAKARAKNLRKSTENPAMFAGECLFLDVMGPFEPMISRSWFDAKIVDQFSRKTWSCYIKTKDQIADLFKKHIDTFKGMGKTVKYLHCDNVSEQGGKLSALCKECGIQIE